MKMRRKRLKTTRLPQSAKDGHQRLQHRIHLFVRSKSVMSSSASTLEITGKLLVVVLHVQGLFVAGEHLLVADPTATHQVS